MSQRVVDQVPMSLWSDNPTSIDLLGFSDTAELIEKVLLDDALSPVTVGIEGDWGSGKTSLLNLLARKLGYDGSVIVVETHPWEYDPAMDPKATVIAEVLDALHAEVDQRNLLDRVRLNFKALAKRVRVSKLLKLGVTAAAAAGGLPKVADFLGLLDEEAETVPDQGLHGFRKEFEDLMKALPEIHRVVVLVDDLDRCLPQTVVATLEAVKLFLSVEGMAFMLAADRRVVAHAVEIKYQPSPDAAELGRQYSEKIVQVPVPVPALLQEADTEAYLALLLMQHHLDDDRDNRLENLFKHCKGQRAAGKSNLFDEDRITDLGAAAKEDLDLAKSLSAQLHDRLNGNPRRLKRFLNAYCMRRIITKNTDIELKPEALAMWMVLEECEPKAFAELVAQWRMGKTDFEQWLQRLKDGKTDGIAGGQAEVLRSWMQMGPPPSELNPNLYLRLAAPLRRQVMPEARPSGGRLEGPVIKDLGGVIHKDLGSPLKGFGSPHGPSIVSYEHIDSPEKNLGIVIHKGFGSPQKDLGKGRKGLEF
jgi:predicted KAP-like P-loop ATPase